MHTKGTSWNPKSNTLQHKRPLNEHLSICVIAQQYSSAICISLRFHSHNGKFCACFKNFIALFYFLKNYVCLKLRNLKLCKLEFSVYFINRILNSYRLYNYKSRNCLLLSLKIGRMEKKWTCGSGSFSVIHIGIPRKTGPSTFYVASMAENVIGLWIWRTGGRYGRNLLRFATPAFEN